MLRKIIYFAIHQPLFVFLLLVLFIGAGVFAFRTLPIEAFPDVTDIQVTVVTLYPGPRGRGSRKAGHDPGRDRAERPAALGARVLAHAVRALVHLHHFRRRSGQLLRPPAGARAAATRVDLPEGIRPELAPLSSPIGEIYRVYLKSDKYDAIELRSIEDWVVERNLKLVPGVADVVSRGGFIKQYQVCT